MRVISQILVASALVVAGAAGAAGTDGSGFAEELSAIQLEFDHANFADLSKSERKQAFEALVEHAADFSQRHSDRVEAVAWNGIVLSTYAGEVGKLSAMKYAKAALEALQNAESMTPTALNGGIYASLGALYSKVPGGFVGFGDDEIAADYFSKALAVNADNIDTNYFYGEFLIDQEDFAKATQVLNKALNAPTVEARPLFDTGRRATIRELLAEARQ